MIAGISACTSEPEPEYAAQITESTLLAMNENDYAKHTEHFDEPMKNAVPETVFQQANATIKAKIGNYTSKEFWKVETQDEFTIVHYKTKFSQEPDTVIVRVIFREIGGKVYVSGLWFDSPKLRQE